MKFVGRAIIGGILGAALALVTFVVHASTLPDYGPGSSLGPAMAVVGTGKFYLSVVLPSATAAGAVLGAAFAGFRR